MEGTQYWFNIRTGQVETLRDKSPGKDLLGPYDSYAAASQALDLARQQTEAWDEEDRRWREGDED
jgi:hypothetical protein